MNRKILMTVIGIALLMTNLNAQYNTATTGNTGRNPYENPNRSPNIYGNQSNENHFIRKRNISSNDVTVNEAPPEFTDNVEASIPVDGGLGFLLAAGVGYGIRRLRNRIPKSR